MANIIKISTKTRHKKIEKRLKESETFIVRDARERDWFFVDNKFLDGKWLRLLKGAPAAVYFSLCRHSDQAQIAFPSVQWLMDETGYMKRHIINAIRTLEFHHFITVDRQKGEGNMYTLLNKKHWRKAIVVRKYVLKRKNNE
jgi:hypothetical protein